MRTTEIVAQTKTKTSARLVKRALTALVAEKRVVHSGATLSSRWVLASAGSRPAPGFETVWNGTKERAGEAPSLVPPRERKAG